MFPPGRRHLQAQSSRRPDPDTARVGVEAPLLDVPAVLVRLATVKHRALNAHGPHVQGRGDDVRRNVGRVLVVMGQRRRRVGRGRKPVHIDGRSDGRLAPGSQVQTEARALREAATPQRAELHEEIVRVLPIHQQHVLVSLAPLKELGCALPRHRHRLGGEGAEKREGPAPHRPRRHDHHVVLRLEVLVARAAPLAVGSQEGPAVDHRREASDAGRCLGARGRGRLKYAGPALRPRRGHCTEQDRESDRSLPAHRTGDCGMS